MTDTLIALFIVMLFLPVVVWDIGILEQCMHSGTWMMDDIALFQMRRILLLSYHMEINDSSLRFRYQTEERIIREINGNLVLQPGTVILLSDVQDVYFYDDQDILYISFEKGGNQYDYALIEMQ